MPANSDLVTKILEMQKELERLSSALRAVEVEARRPVVPLQEGPVLPLAPVQGWLLSMIESYMAISRMGNSRFYAADVHKLHSFINEQNFKMSIMPEYRHAAGEMAKGTANFFKDASRPFR